MTYRGRVKNGQITLDEPVPLPDGATVTVDVLADIKAKGDGNGGLLRQRRTCRITPDVDLARDIATSTDLIPDEF